MAVESPSPRRRSIRLSVQNKRKSMLQLENTITERTRQLLDSWAQNSHGSIRRSLRGSLRSSLSKKENGNNSRVVGAGAGAGGGGGGAVKELDHGDVEIGKLLGEGGFSHVYELKNVKRQSFIDLVVRDVKGAGFDSDTCSSHGGNLSDDEDEDEDAATLRKSAEVSKNFVVKHLNASVRQDRSRYHAAAADLAFEAKLLSTLSHPNIIRLRGVTRGSEVSSLYAGSKQRGGADEGLGSGYFIVLDKLGSTLQERIKEWREEKGAIKQQKRKSRSASMVLRRLSSSLDASHHSHEGTRSSGGGSGAKEAKREFLLRRLDVARRIASAMSYLHSRRILYRDLKPENVGFDAASGDVKIFDFGLARFLPKEKNEEEEEEDDDGKGGCGERRLTGMAGTPRYMAPEVAKFKEYGLPADVHSYGLVLWEILALKQPFDKITMKELQAKVVYGTKRPKVDAAKCPKTIRDLMERCWAIEPKDRPEFKHILEVLDEELDVFLR